MKIVVDGKVFTLRETDVQIAKQALNRFMKVIKEGAAENNMPLLYIAFLAVMKVKATDMLNNLDPEQLAEVVRLLELQKNSEIFADYPIE